MNQPEICPDLRVLRSVIHGEASAAEQAALETHLEHCSSCAQQLEQLASDRSDWIRIAEGLCPQGNASNHPPATIMSDRSSLESLRSQGESGFDPAEYPFLTDSTTKGSLGRIEHCEVVELIGRGSMGVVFKAKDTVLARTVAVKVMLPERAIRPVDRLRFQREAQAIAAVSHEHVVAIYAVGEAARGVPYFVMPFISGVTLQQLLDAKGALDVSAILRIGMQMAAGLAAAHAQGLVHRDIKPGNILLENGVQRVKITDFGLARANEDVDVAGLTAADSIVGTPEYMSPEQARGERVDQRSDLFSLGSVLYAMCTGAAPFRGGSVVAVLRAVCESHPAAIRGCNPLIPPALVHLVEQLMSKSHAARPDSAAAVSSQLERQLAELQSPPVSEPAVASMIPRRDVAMRWAAIATLALLVVVLIAYGGNSVFRGRHADHAPDESTSHSSLVNSQHSGEQSVHLRSHASRDVIRLLAPTFAKTGFVETEVASDRVPATGFLRIAGLTEVGFPAVAAAPYALETELELSSAGSGVCFDLGRAGEWRLEFTLFHDLAKQQVRAKLARRGPRAFFTPGSREMPGLGRRVRLIVLVSEGRSWLLHGEAIILSTPVAPPAVLAIAGTTETSTGLIHKCTIRPLESREQALVEQMLKAPPPIAEPEGKPSDES